MGGQRQRLRVRHHDGAVRTIEIGDLKCVVVERGMVFETNAKVHGQFGVHLKTVLAKEAVRARVAVKIGTCIDDLGAHR